MLPAPTRTYLTNSQKLQLKHFWNDHPHLPFSALVEWVRERFGVSLGRATLYRIYHARIEDFAGNGKHKKGRRVKFPALEKDIVAFYEQNQQLYESSGTTLSDDELLRAAADLRARHGILETELKLSNGWLYRFKERHALRAPSLVTGKLGTRVATYDATGGLEATQVAAVQPKRKVKAPLRRQQANAPMLPAKDGNVDTLEVADQADTLNASPQNLTTSGANVPEDTSGIATTSHQAAGIQPLTYVAAVAAESVTAGNVIPWTWHSGMAHETFFSVDHDAVSILRDATYHLSVELHHTSSPLRFFPVIFKVWDGSDLLGQCVYSVRSEGGRTFSLLQVECTLSAQAAIRVEYHAPGVVYRDSRLVLRYISEDASIAV